MGKAFVAKLAKEGARDPEALAAWIGRQKHGKRGFQTLAKAGRDSAQQQRQLMGRVRPFGRLSRDLAGFSDTELGRALSGLTPDEAGRVAAEMDRRDRASQLPGVRPDLVGLSDEQLAERSRGADAETLAAVADEANRRDRLQQNFPDGRLRADLEQVGDDDLAWSMQYATTDDVLRIAAEMDRRDAVALPKAADTGNPVADMLADRSALDAALSPAPGPEEWGVHAGGENVWPEGTFGADPDRPIDGIQGSGSDEQDQQERRVTRNEARQMYDAYVYQQWLKAEDDCRGELLNAAAEAARRDPQALFSGPARVAYAHASDELKEWWGTHGRLTQAEFIEQATGQKQRDAERARNANAEHQLRR
ncbi:hypothetical protein [Streptomyces lunaelactis]|uniref:hypothetical protein n=1 Tax=Streptomyces lunaelactis TaxID=1535768 RepID=UPI001585C9E2|nr:hypothetical protein [Streptomyces lunaelactis]NUK22062.1 hypothetical protein [Streptomyces lunaelactis]